MTVNGLGRAFLRGEIGVRYVREAAKLAKNVEAKFDGLLIMRYSKEYNKLCC